MGYPVIIGGIGGSGTRIIAAILQEFNYYLGDDLNESLDNLTYTLLFKRPRWYYKNYNKTGIINTGLKILEKKLTGDYGFTPIEYTYIINATQSMYRFGHNAEKSGSGNWAFKRLSNIINGQTIDIRSYTGWGWKEPNSHLILRNINNYFPEFKYIHTIRHGLDMAYSNNQQQLFNWGLMHGVPVPETKEKLPPASFRYWVEVNRKMIELRSLVGKDKILILNFDNLCVSPKIEIQKIIDFLGITVSDSQLIRAIQIPIIPASKDRFKGYNLSIFREDDLQFLQSMGFGV